MDLCCMQIDILRHLGKHRNIVSLHDVLYLEDETIMLTDLVEGGELFDYIVDMVGVLCSAGSFAATSQDCSLCCCIVGVRVGEGCGPPASRCLSST
jgi:serine/threonine protein kinase